MTTPNPTPTTREREAAREIARWICKEWDFSDDTSDDMHERMTERIAAALARERREALTEAEEYLRTHVVVYDSHSVKGGNFRTEVRHGASLGSQTEGEVFAAAIERLRDGEKG